MTEIIVNFLFQQPPPDVLTYNSLAEHLWNKIVMNLGAQRGAKVLRVTVDKPKYLPMPWQLLHASRSSRSGFVGEAEGQITGDGEVLSAKDSKKY